MYVPDYDAIESMFIITYLNKFHVSIGDKLSMVHTDRASTGVYGTKIGSANNTLCKLLQIYMDVYII